MDSFLIGYNGTTIECAEGQHVFTMIQNPHLQPFVVVHYGKAEFEEDFMCKVGLKASRRQKESVFDWCMENNLNFDEVFFDAEE